MNNITRNSASVALISVAVGGTMGGMVGKVINSVKKVGVSNGVIVAVSIGAYFIYNMVNLYSTMDAFLERDKTSAVEKLVEADKVDPEFRRGQIQKGSGRNKNIKNLISLFSSAILSP